MGRPKGSKNKTLRVKARTPYQTYSDWYDKYTKGHKKGWFAPKYSKAEFDQEYNLAKLAKLKNPARSVAMSQLYVERSFIKAYKKQYGKDLGDITDKQTRIDIAETWVKEKMAEGLDESDAWEEFREYFY
jgi:hypothetical protein